MATRRTNIEIDVEVVQRVMERYGLATKREAVHFALLRAASAPLTVDEVLAERGAGHLRDDMLGYERPAR